MRTYHPGMEIEISKGSDRDWIRIRRADGSEETSTFPKKGMIPHDAVHFFVERELPLADGFWGHVASGTAIGAIQQIARDAGHASAKRADSPEPHIVQLLQAERLVECFEADHWSGGTDAATFRAAIAAACAASLVPVPPVDEANINRIREQIAGFAAKWTAAPIGAIFRFAWDPEQPGRRMSGRMI